MTKDHFNSLDYFAMDIALFEAQKAFNNDEVPVGAALFIGNKLIVTGFNQVEKFKDASMHAELICLKKAAKILGDFRLNEGVLYSTLEPCSMCAGAIYNFRIAKLVYGAKDLRVGACGSLYNLFEKNHPITNIDYIGGLREEESAKLLRSFFRKKREEKSEKVFEELIQYQKKRLLKTAREINPNLTEEDILQPFDFKELEDNSSFRYEEGIYCGLLSAKAAVFAKQKSKL